MIDEKYAELERRALEPQLADSIRQAEIRSRVHAEVQNMLQSGEAIVLTDEERRMITSFRRFKLRMRKDGEVFTWQSIRPEGVQIVRETANIVAPEEVRIVR